MDVGFATANCLKKKNRERPEKVRSHQLVWVSADSNFRSKQVVFLVPVSYTPYYACSKIRFFFSHDTFCCRLRFSERKGAVCSVRSMAQISERTSRRPTHLPHKNKYHTPPGIVIGYSTQLSTHRLPAMLILALQLTGHACRLSLSARVSSGPPKLLLSHGKGYYLTSSSKR